MNQILACVLTFASVWLAFLGLTLITLDVWRVACLQLAYPDGEPVHRYPVPAFRWGALALRTRPGADVVELHNRERGAA